LEKSGEISKNSFISYNQVRESSRLGNNTVYVLICTFMFFSSNKSSSCASERVLSESALSAIASVEMHLIKPAAKTAFGLKQKVLNLLLKMIIMEF